MRRRLRLRTALLASAALVLVLAAISVARGGYEVVEPRVLGSEALPPPGWTRPCWVLEPGTADKPFSLRCARLEGTVLFREGTDPDGDGDRHLLVLAGVRLVKVKFREGKGPRRLPGIGSQVEYVGHATGSRLLTTVEPDPPEPAERR